MTSADTLTPSPHCEHSTGQEADKSHVISLIHPENKGSIRVAEKLGEKVEGRTEVMGIDVLIYGVDRPAK
jgi:RimJ/RimL family protein N-acetyltransferase